MFAKWPSYMDPRDCLNQSMPHTPIIINLTYYKRRRECNSKIYRFCFVLFGF